MFKLTGTLQWFVSRGIVGLAIIATLVSTIGWISTTPVWAASTDTGLISPAAQVAESGGDGNGFEVSPGNALADDGAFAADMNSGSSTTYTCTDATKDKHRFSGYSFGLPADAAISGIEVRLDAKADANAPGGAKLCVQMSWDGGASWTTAKSTAILSTAEISYTLGSSADTWGHSWAATEFSGTQFQVRVISMASNTSRDFSLDWVAVRLYYETSTSTATPTPVPTNTPGPTATPPPGGAHLDNPFVGATWYVNQYWQGHNTYNVNTFFWMDSVAAVNGSAPYPMGLAGHLDAAVAQGANLIGIVIYDLPSRDCAALSSSGEFQIAQDGLNKYKTLYIDPIVSILGSNPAYANLRIVAVIEPDSLPNLVTNLSVPKCAEANTSGAYVQGVQYAINQLSAFSNVYMYVDIAHSGWLGWDNNLAGAADLISNTIKGTTLGVNSINGFVSNTSGATPVDEVFLPNPNLKVGAKTIKTATFYESNPMFDERDYGIAMRNAFIARGFPSTIGMLIDTGRNGWGGCSYTAGNNGCRPTAVSTSTNLNTYVNQSRIDRRFHRGNWCNQASGIGILPVANPAAGFDAFVWVKPPGESDGTSNPASPRFDGMCDPNGSSQGVSTGAMPNAPEAGQWFQAGFDQLVANKYP